MKNINCLILFFFSIANISNAQIADEYVGKMMSITEDKAYLSFDKPYYTTGETMYFKAFLADATSHSLDSFRTILYVDFIETETKRVILQQKLKMDGGRGSGSFSTEGVKGAVFVHAYTRWMGNLEADYHFNKNIQVFGAKDPLALLPTVKKGEKEASKKVILPATKLDVPEVNNDSIRRVQAEIDKGVVIRENPLLVLRKVKNLQFFPESGNILPDFANRVAFKATNNEGKGIAVKGIIKNEKGDTINQFSDLFLGMGRFHLVAKNNEKYTAVVQNEDGTNTIFPLPDVQTQGASIVVEQKHDTADIRLTFYISYDSVTMPNAFYILAHQRGKVAYYSPVLVKNKRTLRTFKLMLPRAIFNEEGIVTVTLFDEKGEPIAERLFFLQNKNRQLSIKLSTEKAVFDKRERVTVNIETKTTDGKPVAAELSFAVTNNEKMAPPQYREDLRAYMLLRSDLRGHIEQPSYYFEDTTAKARLALDNLLMTQGWRRFVWNGKVDSLAFKRESGLSLQAVLRNRKKPAENALLLLLLNRTEERTQSFFTQTDAKGHFELHHLDFVDSALLYVNIANSNRTYTVQEESPKTPPSVLEPKIYLFDEPSGNLDAYLAGSQAVLLSQKQRVEKEIMLEEIEVKARKKDPFEGDTRIRNGFADRSYTIDENEQGSVISFLQGKGIRVNTTQDGDVLLSQGRGSISGTNYGLVVDGFGQFDGRMLNSMFMNDIQRIDIINSGNGGYMVGSSAESDVRTDGVVHILTKAGNPDYWKKYGNTIKSDVPTLLLTGYSREKQFYTPNYAENKAEYILPDHRTTLYWSSTVQTDTTGKATVSFYTSDDAQTAKIQVEGIDRTGKIGVAKGVFKVQ